MAQHHHHHHKASPSPPAAPAKPPANLLDQLLQLVGVAVLVVGGVTLAMPWLPHRAERPAGARLGMPDHRARDSDRAATRPQMRACSELARRALARR
jgi:hypothetical protein